MNKPAGHDVSPRLPAVERAILIILDSCGCGALPDAAEYGDQGADTLGNLARAVGGISLPELGRLGLGHVTGILGVPPAEEPRACHGKLVEASKGKDTTTGHWELCGILTERAFPTFPHGFPEEMLAEFRRQTGRAVLGNKPASGTAIIEELGERHLGSGALIVYTSADSVFQIAAHEEVVPLDELYAACEQARRICDRYGIGRVIARPFVGRPSGFRRTYNRRDYAMPPPAPTLLDRLCAAGHQVLGIGKIHDIFSGRGVSRSIHTEGNTDGLARTLEAVEAPAGGLIFVNLVDFDMLYGHRNDAPGYARALAEVDAFVPRLLERLRPSDLVIFTADHGNDPTTPGTDHTREHVPLLAMRGGQTAGHGLGVRRSFADVGQTIAEALAIARLPLGESFLGELGR
jgi:phosphopentomutase